MDVQAIRQVCLTTATGEKGLRSLQFQNHLYGCFIVMEDIAQGTVELSGTVIRTPTFVFDLEARFDEIGLHYGFLLDTQLRWGGEEAYRRCWIEAFQATGREKKIDTVDRMEDVLIELVGEHLPAESSFFTHALHTGVLPHEWIDRALALLCPVASTAVASVASAASEATAAVAASGAVATVAAVEETETANPEPTVWNHAHIEKTSLKRRLRFTRRARPMMPKKHLGHTRRHQ
jgi:hypothetical protein